MKESTIYEAQPGELIEDSALIALEESRREHDYVFLLFNGVTVKVNPKDTVDEITDRYFKKFYDSTNTAKDGFDWESFKREKSADFLKVLLGQTGPMIDKPSEAVTLTELLIKELRSTQR